MGQARRHLGSVIGVDVYGSRQTAVYYCITNFVGWQGEKRARMGTKPHEPLDIFPSR